MAVARHISFLIFLCAGLGVGCTEPIPPGDTDTTFLDTTRRGGIPPIPDTVEETDDIQSSNPDAPQQPFDALPDIQTPQDIPEQDTMPADLIEEIDTPPDIDPWIDTAHTDDIVDIKADIPPLPDTFIEPEDTEVIEEDVGDPPVKEDCCETGTGPGCLDPDCEDLICESDPYCCSSKWDVLCMNAALEQCEVCLPPLGDDCCTANEIPGCDQIPCAQAVCAIDAFCCDTNWDQGCATCAAGGISFFGDDCFSVTSVCDCPELPPSAFDLAAHWAPVWYHDTDDSDAKADYIVAYDFDGDLISDNNWENLHTSEADLSAFIYYSVVETETHWFITYADFHPRDWDEDCNPFPWVTEPCHENDMEGAMVMVRKTADTYGEFVLLYTEAHDTLHIFANDDAITEKSNPHLEEAGVTFEEESHPELYVESKGHGVCALYFDGPDHCKHPNEGSPPPFPGGDGIVYRYKGSAEIPSSGADTDVGYELVSLETSLWIHRENICDSGCLFDTTMAYESATLAKAFDGDTWGEDRANPPWAWDDPDDGDVYRGDFFFRPAETVFKHVVVPHPVSFNYISNTFLNDL